MKRYKIVFFVYFISLFVIIIIFNIHNTLAQTTFNAQVPISQDFKSKVMTGDGGTIYIGQYIQAIYKYGISIGAILATIVLMAAGIVWLTSGGSQGQVGKAKEMITGSLVGLFLLFGSWTILNIINPALVNLRTSKIDMIERLELGCCEFFQENNTSWPKAEMMNSALCKKINGNFKENDLYSVYIIRNNYCESIKIKCMIRIDCDDNVEVCYESEFTNQYAGATRKNCGNYFAQSFKNVYIRKDGSCSLYSECNNKTAVCQNNDGQKCNNWPFKNIDCYCYNSLAYIGKGIHGEPCGTKPNALCSNQLCSASGAFHDRTGRECFTENAAHNLCCYNE
jgi:hypothetical protein